MRRLTLATTVAVVAGIAATHAGATCTPAKDKQSVARAVASQRDVWGDRLLHAPGGPALGPALSLLPPLTRGLQWEGHPLTASGAYYLPFSFPFTSKGSTVYALHVADGSQIFTRTVKGPSLTIEVAGKPYASCATHL